MYIYILIVVSSSVRELSCPVSWVRLPCPCPCPCPCFLEVVESAKSRFCLKDIRINKQLKTKITSPQYDFIS